jgi:hypothetical protein
MLGFTQLVDCHLHGTIFWSFDYISANRRVHPSQLRNPLLLPLSLCRQFNFVVDLLIRDAKLLGTKMIDSELLVVAVAAKNTSDEHSSLMI